MALADTVKLATIILLESRFAYGRAPASCLPVAAPEFGVPQFIAACEVAQQLESLQGRLRAIAERQCNGYSYGYHGATYYSQEQAARAESADERNAEKLQAKVAALLAPYGVGATFNGDPRGSAIKLATPKSGQYNTWGGKETGWAVS